MGSFLRSYQRCASAALESESEEWTKWDPGGKESNGRKGIRKF